MTTDRSGLSQFFTVVAIVCALFLFGVVTYFYIGEKWEVRSWGVLVADIMVYYLVFTTFRSGTVLAFSFMEHLFKRTRGEPSYFPLVSIIVPCFNEEKVVQAAIQSILELNYPNFEVLVIDDGSADLTTELAKRFEERGKLRVIYQPNAGKASALNRGISEAVGEFVLCVDADSVLGTNVLMNAMPYFETDPQLGAVAGSVRVGNSKSLICKFQKLEYVISLNLLKKAQSLANLVTIVPGPIGIFKKSVLVEIGGYRSNTFAEDCDLSMRLLLAGYHIKYAPDCVATTEVPDTFNGLMIQRYRWSRGMIQAISKNMGWLMPSRISFRNFLILFTMTVETIFIPMANFLFGLLALQYALLYGSSQMMGAYFFGLVELDLAMSLYAIATERHVAGYFLLSILNRVTFGFALEVMRFFSILDEMLRIPMKWGVLERKGLVK